MLMFGPANSPPCFIYFSNTEKQECVGTANCWRMGIVVISTKNGNVIDGNK
jgi:hypothetical protein